MFAAGAVDGISRPCLVSCRLQIGQGLVITYVIIVPPLSPQDDRATGRYLSDFAETERPHRTPVSTSVRESSIGF